MLIWLFLIIPFNNREKKSAPPCGTRFCHMSEIHSLLCRWQEYFAVVELWFSLQMDRWDVFIQTKHTCSAFCSLQWSAFILPFPSLLPAIFIPGGEPCWTNGLLLSATHRFSVAWIKDLPDIILSYMSLCQRSNETHNLMFHLTSLTSHFEFAATHSFTHFVWKEAAWHRIASTRLEHWTRYRYGRYFVFVHLF